MVCRADPEVMGYVTLILRDDNGRNVNVIINVTWPLSPWSFSSAWHSKLWQNICFVLALYSLYIGRFKGSNIFSWFQGIIMILCGLCIHYVDTSRMYHVIRGQAVIKLYIFFNMLDVGDRLLASFGQVKSCWCEKMECILDVYSPAFWVAFLRFLFRFWCFVLFYIFLFLFEHCKREWEHCGTL